MLSRRRFLGCLFRNAAMAAAMAYAPATLYVPKIRTDQAFAAFNALLKEYYLPGVKRLLNNKRILSRYLCRTTTTGRLPKGREFLAEFNSQ